MPLSILAILVVLGIGTIVAIVHFSGLSQEAVIRDGSQVKNLLAQDFPGITFDTNPVITTSFNAAFVPLADSNKLGLVEVFGDRYFTRIISQGDIKNSQKRDDQTLRVAFAEFTLRNRTYKFSDSADLANVAKWIEKSKDKS